MFKKISRKILTCIALSLLALPQLQAQNATANAVELEVFHLVSMQKAAKLYFQNSQGDYAPLKIATSGRGKINLIQRKPTLTLYRSEVVDGEKIMKPALTLNLPAGASRALLFFYLDSDDKVQYRILRDSPEMHQGGQLRVLNLTEQDVVVLIQNEQMKLVPGQEETKDVHNGDKKFSFAFAMLEPKPFKSPVKTLPMRTVNHRLLIVFTYLKKPVYDNAGNIASYTLVPDSTRLYDRLPN